MVPTRLYPKTLTVFTSDYDLFPYRRWGWWWPYCWTSSREFLSHKTRCVTVVDTRHHGWHSYTWDRVEVCTGKSLFPGFRFPSTSLGCARSLTVGSLTVDCRVSTVTELKFYKNNLQMSQLWKSGYLCFYCLKPRNKIEGTTTKQWYLSRTSSVRRFPNGRYR